MTDYILQGVGETITRTFDYTDVLPSGETVSSATVTPAGNVSSQSVSSPYVTVDVSGLTFGQIIRLKCAATFSNGEIVEKQATIRAGQR